MRRPGALAAGLGDGGGRAYRRHDADRVVAEVNQGGDLVEAILGRWTAR